MAKFEMEMTEERWRGFLGLMILEACDNDDAWPRFWDAVEYARVTFWLDNDWPPEEDGE